MTSPIDLSQSVFQIAYNPADMIVREMSPSERSEALVRAASLIRELTGQYNLDQLSHGLAVLRPNYQELVRKLEEAASEETSAAPTFAAGLLAGLSTMLPTRYRDVLIHGASALVYGEGTDGSFQFDIPDNVTPLVARLHPQTSTYELDHAAISLALKEIEPRLAHFYEQAVRRQPNPPRTLHELIIMDYDFAAFVEDAEYHSMPPSISPLPRYAGENVAQLKGPWAKFLFELIVKAAIKNSMGTWKLNGEEIEDMARRFVKNLALAVIQPVEQLDLWEVHRLCGTLLANADAGFYEWAEKTFGPEERTILESIRELTAKDRIRTRQESLRLADLLERAVAIAEPVPMEKVTQWQGSPITHVVDAADTMRRELAGLREAIAAGPAEATLRSYMGIIIEIRGEVAHARNLIESEPPPVKDVLTRRRAEYPLEKLDLMVLRFTQLVEGHILSPAETREAIDILDDAIATLFPNMIGTWTPMISILRENFLEKDSVPKPRVSDDIRWSLRQAIPPVERFIEAARFEEGDGISKEKAMTALENLQTVVEARDYLTRDQAEETTEIVLEIARELQPDEDQHDLLTAADALLVMRETYLGGVGVSEETLAAIRPFLEWDIAYVVVLSGKSGSQKLGNGMTVDEMATLRDRLVAVLSGEQDPAILDEAIKLAQKYHDSTKVEPWESITTALAELKRLKETQGASEGSQKPQVSDVIQKHLRKAAGYVGSFGVIVSRREVRLAQENLQTVVAGDYLAPDQAEETAEILARMQKNLPRGSEEKKALETAVEDLLIMRDTYLDRVGVSEETLDAIRPSLERDIALTVILLTANGVEEIKSGMTVDEIAILRDRLVAILKGERDPAILAEAIELAQKLHDSLDNDVPRSFERAFAELKRLQETGENSPHSSSLKPEEVAASGAPQVFETVSKETGGKPDLDGTGSDGTPKASSTETIMGIAGFKMDGQMQSSFTVGDPVDSAQARADEIRLGAIEVYDDQGAALAVLPDSLEDEVDVEQSAIRIPQSAIPDEWETTVIEAIALAERKGFTEVVHYLEFASDAEAQELFTGQKGLFANLIKAGYADYVSQLSQAGVNLSDQEIIQINAAIVSGAPVEVHQLVSRHMPETAPVDPVTGMPLIGTANGTTSVLRSPVLRVVR